MSFLTIDSDTEEYNDLELEDLVDQHIVSLNLKQIALNLMYATYQVSRGEERADLLHRYFSWNMSTDVKIDEIFTIGPEELLGTDSFMEEWIAFLKKMDGDRAADRLTEACVYHGGNDLLIEMAREVWERHPILYQYACENHLHAHNVSDCEQLGLEAIRVLPKKLIVRGKIADLAAKAAKQLRHMESVIECYEAAFYADSTLNHYLRLFELPDEQNRAERLQNTR